MGRRRGFTLIELLVVIAIIGILAGMLFPVFVKVRDKARQTTCLASIKQLALAMTMYTDDYDGGFVPAQSQDQLARWHGRRATVNDPFEPSWGPLWDYLKTKELKHCTGFSPPDSEALGQYELGGGGYGYNAQYVGGSPSADYRVGMYIPAHEWQINDPSKTILFTDTASLNCEGTLTEYSFCEAPTYQAWGNMLAAPTTHFRHGGFANVAFCDGHAKGMKMVYTQATGNCPYGFGEVYTTEAYKKFHLGFLSEDNSLYDRE